MNVGKILFSLGMVVLLSACASTPKPESDEIDYEHAQVIGGGFNLPKPDKVEKKPKKVAAKKTLKGPLLTGEEAVEQAKKYSTIIPRTPDFNNAVTVYPFEKDKLYNIYTAPLQVTDIEFQIGEKITSVAGGDTLRWQVLKSYSGEGSDMHEHLVVKPNEPELDNSLLVMTTMRTYHLNVISTKDGTSMPGVRWSYPKTDSDNDIPTIRESMQTIFEGVDEKNIDDNYSTKVMSSPTGSLKPPVWMPTHVFTDGDKTYIEFPKHLKERPVLFVGTDWHAQEIVNYRAVANYFIVDHVVQHARLQIGSITGGEKNPTVVQITYHGKYQ